MIKDDAFPSLFQQLKAYAASGAVPMHVPGHKRNAAGIAFLEKLGARYDITEIAGFDDLHHPHGILREAMKRAAALWNSADAFFLVNGSTCGILAAVAAASKLCGNGTLIMARNCHRSVYNAAELNGLTPVYIAPPTVAGFGFCGSISPKAIEIAVQDNLGTPIILTSPTYEGVISNIAEIAVICHMYGSPLIVDEAHGAHLGLSPYFTGGAVHAGADIVIQSVHKTLTGLTQTGLLHLSGGLIRREDILRELSVYETSSPSYLLMAAIDGTRELVEERGSALFQAWRARLDRFDGLLSPVQNLRLPGHGELFSCQKRGHQAGYSGRGIESAEVCGFDRSKILISCEGTDTTGVAVMDALRAGFGIECEMAACGHAVAMTGLLDSDEHLEKLAAALAAVDAGVRRTAPRVPFTAPKIPPRRMAVSQARRQPARALALRDARGRICAEYIWAYPPGIPLVVPGEELTDEVVSSLSIQREAGVLLYGSGGGMPKTVCVLR
ncbi:MAG: amino acid decarboxylase [Oscillospiraceae bacterium]|jgi:arginine/lysine/ornithine decarboxylase|nr:amino acid decarboxylase [Oscillospiraceae bacterium]